MKTKILKWDVNVVAIILIVNVMGCAAYLLHKTGLTVLLGLQFTGLAYQLLGCISHLFLGHKSVGYRQWRKYFIIGGFVYLLLVFFIAFRQHCHAGNGPALLLIMGAISIAMGMQAIYYLIEKSELQYLQNREFFILR